MNLLTYGPFWLAVTFVGIVVGLVLGFTVSFTLGLIVMSISAVLAWALLTHAAISVSEHQEVTIIVKDNSQERIS